jgi:hypothetical protein
LASDLLTVSGNRCGGKALWSTSLPNQLSSFGRIVIVGPIPRKCPEVVAVAVHKIPERCKQATESGGTERSEHGARWETDSH